MRVAVLGAGVAGLVAARRLAREGHAPVVLERWPGLGGQAATIDVGRGHLVERYYHHWFTSDAHVRALCDELGVAVGWHPSSVGFLVDGRVLPFTGPLDLLRFDALPLRDRLRMGIAVLRLQRSKAPLAAFERETARAWIEREMGPEAWRVVWGPLLRGKFGDRADDVSMAWLWGKLTLRRRLRGEEARQELLGYPAASFEDLLRRLAEDVERHGGEVRTDAPARRVRRHAEGWLVEVAAPGSFRRGHDPRRFQGAGEERFDAVLATVPNDVFAAVLDDDVELAPGYAERLERIEYHAALCLLLELDRPFGTHYWTNVADDAVPFVGLVEHTNLVPAERYDGRRFLYVANYLDRGDERLGWDAERLLASYGAGLRAANPAFDPAWVRAMWLHREPAAQPVVTVGYERLVPPLQTGAPGLVLANTTSIYPEDRGTNYAVRLGEDAARAVLGR